MKIEGRTFVVSGGASGLGQAAVQEICRNGGNVAILDLNEHLGAELVKQLPQGAAKFFVCDVTETESITAAVAGVVEWIRETTKPMGGIIPAAGVGNPSTILDKHGDAFSLDSFDFVVNINLRGTVDLVRQCLVHLAKTEPVSDDQERGVVIMVASVAAFDGQKGQVAYAASKGAVASMTLPMTRDLARYGIRCVTVAPGIFESRMTAVLPKKLFEGLAAAMEFPRRAGKPAEFAQLVKQIIENSMLNGTVIRLDGGLRMPSKI
ncbi:short chain dehydrogenase [Xylaria bambusicola]|uniref:short chain dehydrogenase n=1 Tax=Xylaria bambusicola TaxID=326684 RepID=UPI0020072A40|nr:short chain dehydrogenase [Xylaria bambusicola]KAI0509124.1 short chain dehydrogenase [Xylaria bambusicola]